MADTNLYLSKINLGGKDYFLKDTGLRKTVADLQAAGLEIVIKDQAWVNDPLNAKESRGKLILVKDAGSETGTYVEYVAVNTESGYVFERIGTTAADLTDYVMKTAKVAGIDLQDDITAEDMKKALSLGALAYKASATGEYTKATGITGASYTPAGSVTATVATELANVTSTGKHTPEGTVSGTVQPTGTVEITLGEADNYLGVAQVNRKAYTPAGKVSVALENNTVQSITGVGTQASFKEGAFTAATLGHAENSFATAGIVASVIEPDETLKLVNADTAQASLINSFNGGSKVADEFTANELPTHTEVKVGVKSASFTGTEDATLGVDTVKYKKTTASAAFTGDTNNISATFKGTEGNVSVSGQYEKATTASGDLKGTAATITPTLNTATATVTVE